MYTRKNQRDLTPGERRAFVEAVLELRRRGDYEWFVRTHVQYFVPDGEDGLRAAHMTPSFLPWHRRFVLRFEEALREIDTSVSVPYWDWTVDSTPGAALWQDDFLGGTGRQGDQQVMTGPFAYGTGNWTISGGVTDDRFLTRDLGGPRRDPVALPTNDEVERALGATAYDVAPWDSTAGAGFRNRLEGWITSGDQPYRNHNRVHHWVGGSMLSGSSPDDPVFWLHHAFIDLLWDRWQARHPGAGYLPAAKLAQGDPQHGRVISRDEPMPPWNEKPSDLLGHAGIYRYA